MKLCFWNNEQFCASDVEIDIGLPGHIWLDAPVDYDTEKVYKLDDGSIVEVPLTEYDQDRLRVFRVLPMSADAAHSDFTILGFVKKSPSYTRGVKVKAEYKCPTKDEMIVEKLFTDIRNQDGILTDLQVTFNWYSENDEIKLSKTEVVKSYNKSEARTEERKRRARQIDYLQAEAEGTTAEPYVDMIINMYNIEIEKYVAHGQTDPWSDAMGAETDPTLVYVLNSVYQPRRDDITKTINTMQSIKYQMGLMTLSEIEIANGEV